MTPKVYPLLERCVDEGIAFGWNRAHKHTDNPSEYDICSSIAAEVLSAICEAFDFPDPTS